MSSSDDGIKAVVSVSEMARLVGLSRARFYQLQREGVFPLPTYDVRSRRPVYGEDDQRRILEVRKRNVGVNGQTILFYARAPVLSRPPARRSAPLQSPRSDIVDALRALGVETTAAAVEPIIRQTFPHGIASIDEGEVIRAVFLRLRRQNSGDNVGR